MLLFYPAKPQGSTDLISALSSSLIHSSLPDAAICQISVGTHFSLLYSFTNFAYSFRDYLPYGYRQTKPSETHRSQLPTNSWIIHRNLSCRFPPRYFVNGTCLVRNLLHCCICMLAFRSPQDPPARPALCLWMQTAPLLSFHFHWQHLPHPYSSCTHSPRASSHDSLQKAAGPLTWKPARTCACQGSPWSLPLVIHVLCELLCQLLVC